MNSELNYLTPEDLEIAKENGIEERLAKERFYKYNRPKEEAITYPRGYRPKSLLHEYRDIAVANGISKGGFYYRVNVRKMGLKEAATRPNERVRSDKEVYREWKEIAKANGINETAFHTRIHRHKWDYERAATEAVGTVKGRPSTHKEKVPNEKRKSKYKGVYWHPPTKKWYSRFMYKGQRIYVGTFETEEEAYAAYMKKRKGMS